MRNFPISYLYKTRPLCSPMQVVIAPEKKKVFQVMCSKFAAMLPSGNLWGTISCLGRDYVVLYGSLCAKTCPRVKLSYDFGSEMRSLHSTGHGEGFLII